MIEKINLPVLTDFSQHLRDRVFSMEYQELCEVAVTVLDSISGHPSPFILACCAEIIARRKTEDTNFSRY